MIHNHALKGCTINVIAYPIYSSERPGRSFNFEFSKGGRLFEGGALSREALIEHIKETSKYFELVS